MRVVFMGTPDFSVPALEIIAENHEVPFVVTAPDKPRNRNQMTPTPVKAKALELGLDVETPETIKGNEEFLAKLKEAAPDCIVVAAYGKILPKEVLDLPKYGCINVHGSLLPRHRGASPIQNAVLLGDPETGVTIMRMEEGLDTGNMILKAAVPVDRKTAGELHDELSQMGANLVYNVLEFFEEGLSFPEIEQDDMQSCYAPLITKKDGELRFGIPADKIERRIRAMSPWPGAYTKYNGEILKVWWADVLPGTSGKRPGTILSVSDDGIEVAAKDDRLLIREIQMPGKKRMEVKEYIKGNSIVEGTVLG